MASKGTRRLRAAVALGTVPAVLSMGGVASASPSLQGQTYITSSQGDLLGGVDGWTGQRGGTITAWADEPHDTASTTPNGPPFMLMQDPARENCGASAVNISDGPEWNDGYLLDTDDADLDTAPDDIGSAFAPKTGTLKTGTGTNWKGTMHICFSNTSHATWAETIIVM